MSYNSFTCIGSGKTLAYLRSDLKAASDTLVIVGPWIDDYFAHEIVLVTPSEIKMRILVRPEKQMEQEAWNRTSAALSIFDSHFEDFKAKGLYNLHAKFLIIDDAITYVGSANWYRYSLEKSIEVVLRGSTEIVHGLDIEFERLWNNAETILLNKEKPIAKIRSFGIDREILDPIAAQVLRDNPKAFFLRNKDD